jgi:hypothetical protein
MAIQRWEMLLSAQTDCYLLKIQGDRVDVDKILLAHPKSCQSVQEISGDVFQWVIFVVDAPLAERLSIQNQVLSLTKDTSGSTPSDELVDILEGLSGALEDLTNLTEEEHVFVMNKMARLGAQAAPGTIPQSPLKSPGQTPPATPSPGAYPPGGVPLPRITIPARPGNPTPPRPSFAPNGQTPANPAYPGPGSPLPSPNVNPNIVRPVQPPRSFPGAPAMPGVPLPSVPMPKISLPPMAAPKPPVPLATPPAAGAVPMPIPQVVPPPQKPGGGNVVPSLAKPALTPKSPPAPPISIPSAGPTPPNVSMPTPVPPPVTMATTATVPPPAAGPLPTPVPPPVTVATTAAVPPPVAASLPTPVPPPITVATTAAVPPPVGLADLNLELKALSEISLTPKIEPLAYTPPAQLPSPSAPLVPPPVVPISAINETPPPVPVLQAIKPDDNSVLRISIFYPADQEPLMDQFLKTLIDVAQKKSKRPTAFQVAFSVPAVISLENSTEWIWKAKTSGSDIFFVILPEGLGSEIMDPVVGEAQAAGLRCFLVPQAEVASKLLYMDLMVELMMFKRRIRAVQ